MDTDTLLCIWSNHGATMAVFWHSGRNMTDENGEIHAIEFPAEIRQVKTMADYSVNLILNVPETHRKHMAVLLEKFIGEYMTVFLVAE